MKTQLLLASLIASGFAVAAIAQDAAAPPEAKSEELMVLPDFKTIDKNEDGRIDGQESDLLSKTLDEEHKIPFRFETVDENRDGLIDLPEYVAYDVVLQDQLGIA